MFQFSSSSLSFFDPGRFSRGPVVGFVGGPHSLRVVRVSQVYVDAKFGVIAGYGRGCSSFAPESWYFHGNEWKMKFLRLVRRLSLNSLML